MSNTFMTQEELNRKQHPVFCKAVKLFKQGKYKAFQKVAKQFHNLTKRYLKS